MGCGNSKKKQEERKKRERQQEKERQKTVTAAAKKTLTDTSASPSGSTLASTPLPKIKPTPLPAKSDQGANAQASNRLPSIRSNDVTSQNQGLQAQSSAAESMGSRAFGMAGVTTSTITALNAEQLEKLKGVPHATKSVQHGSDPYRSIISVPSGRRNSESIGSDQQVNMAGKISFQAKSGQFASAHGSESVSIPSQISRDDEDYTTSGSFEKKSTSFSGSEDKSVLSRADSYHGHDECPSGQKKPASRQELPLRPLTSDHNTELKYDQKHLDATLTGILNVQAPRATPKDVVVATGQQPAMAQEASSKSSNSTTSNPSVQQADQGSMQIHQTKNSNSSKKGTQDGDISEQK